MRLTPSLAAIATRELLDQLRLNGSMTTQEFNGTPMFHGHQTLSMWRIRKLLRTSGQVTETQANGGKYALPIVWRIKGQML